ncbi:hypothetical protein CPC08DRAFT_701812 [Agrocybe pediades]|nr:hypothetical protein CPC08DRAFT_701812 [Agrocybe pediades]
MPYSTRNPFYLRISKSVVLPVYVYLDERHVNWMSDVVLQHVLSDLRPHILEKLKNEAVNLKGSSAAQKKASTVDTHRGDTYQFCYFIRKTEPHSVLIKSRTYHAAPKRTATVPAASSSAKKLGKRKQNEPQKQTRKKKRRVNNTDDEDEDYVDPDGDTDMVADELTDEPPPIELEIEEEEEKPKPTLGLRYQGFSIYGQCLCIVVEPWPVQRSMTVAPLFAKPVEPPQPSKNQQASARASTPLFLPEEPDQPDAPVTTEPSNQRSSHINQAYLDQVLKEGEVEDDDDDDIGGMMELSQALHSIGDSRAGAVNDDEDMDGSVLFGDADEFREL